MSISGGTGKFGEEFKKEMKKVNESNEEFIKRLEELKNKSKSAGTEQDRHNASLGAYGKLVQQSQAMTQKFEEVIAAQTAKIEELNQKLSKVTETTKKKIKTEEEQIEINKRLAASEAKKNIELDFANKHIGRQITNLKQLTIEEQALIKAKKTELYRQHNTVLKEQEKALRGVHDANNKDIGAEERRTFAIQKAADAQARYNRELAFASQVLNRQVTSLGGLSMEEQQKVSTYRSAVMNQYAQRTKKSIGFEGGVSSLAGVNAVSKSWSQTIKELPQRLGSSIGLYEKETGEFRGSTTGLRRGIGALRNNLLLVTFAVSGFIVGLKNLISVALETKTSLIGLSELSGSMGKNIGETNKIALEFANTGLISISGAASTLKNLLATGLSLEKATKLMYAMADAAAFNRQGTLSLEEAVVSGSQGFKNFLPQLIDNMGVTKNLIPMQEEYARSIGTTAKKLTEAQKVEADYLGIMKEAGKFENNRFKLMETFSGKINKITASFKMMAAMIGDAMTPALNRQFDVIDEGITKVRSLGDAFSIGLRVDMLRMFDIFDFFQQKLIYIIKLMGNFSQSSGWFKREIENLGSAALKATLTVAGLTYVIVRLLTLLSVGLGAGWNALIIAGVTALWYIYQKMDEERLKAIELSRRETEALRLLLDTKLIEQKSDLQNLVTKQMQIENKIKEVGLTEDLNIQYKILNKSISENTTELIKNMTIQDLIDERQKLNERYINQFSGVNEKAKIKTSYGIDTEDREAYFRNMIGMKTEFQKAQEFLPFKRSMDTIKNIEKSTSEQRFFASTDLINQLMNPNLSNDLKQLAQESLKFFEIWDKKLYKKTEDIIKFKQHIKDMANEITNAGKAAAKQTDWLDKINSMLPKIPKLGKEDLLQYRKGMTDESSKKGTLIWSLIDFNEVEVKHKIKEFSDYVDGAIREQGLDKARGEMLKGRFNVFFTEENSAKHLVKELEDNIEKEMKGKSPIEIFFKTLSEEGRERRGIDFMQKFGDEVVNGMIDFAENKKSMGVIRTAFFKFREDSGDAAVEALTGFPAEIILDMLNAKEIKMEAEQALNNVENSIKEKLNDIRKSLSPEVARILGGEEIAGAERENYGKNLRAAFLSEGNNAETVNKIAMQDLDLKDYENRKRFNIVDTEQLRHTTWLKKQIDEKIDQENYNRIIRQSWEENKVQGMKYQLLATMHESAYNSMSKVSEMFFDKQQRQLLTLNKVFKYFIKDQLAAYLDAIATQIRADAAANAWKSASMLWSGNPLGFKYAAIAVGQGALAGTLSGTANAIRNSNQREFESSRTGNSSNSSVGRNMIGQPVTSSVGSTTSSFGKQAVNVYPTINIGGGGDTVLVGGYNSIGEAGQALGKIVAQSTRQSLETGELDMNSARKR
jgi:hypothetical protein